MPLQIRRGSTAQRLTITPLAGELIYDTTTGQLYVGDGTTAGGTTTTGISLEDARDAAAAIFTSGVHSGITFSWNDTLDRMDATVTVAATGPFDGDLTGSVFADNSTMLVDGTNGRLVGPLTVSGTSHTVTHAVSSGNSGLTVTGNNFTYAQFISRLKVSLQGSSSSTDHGISIDSFDNAATGPRLTFFKTRGSLTAPNSAVQTNDSIGDIWFLANDGSQTASGLRFGGVVESTPSAFTVPAKFRWQTNIAGSFATRMELSQAGVLSVDRIQAFTGGGAVRMDVIGSLFTDNSTRILDGTSGAITASTISASGTLSVDTITQYTGGAGVDIATINITNSTISTTDSSAITVTQATTFSGNLTVDGTLSVGDSVVQNSPNTDMVSTTLRTQSVDRVVTGVLNGTYTQQVSSTFETFTTLTYNPTTYRGCRALIKASYGSTNVYIGEVLLANTPTGVTIVNAQSSAATIGTSPLSSIGADYDSVTDRIRIRPVTINTLTAPANYNWTISYQLFT